MQYATISVLVVGFIILAPTLLASEIVVQQGGIAITLQDVDTHLERTVPAEHRAGFMDSPIRIEGVLTSMLLTRQLAADARSRGYLQQPDVRQEIDGGADELTVLAAAMRAEIVVAVEASLPDFTELAREHYTVNRPAYVNTGRIDVEHILIDLGEDTELSLARAEQVRALALDDPDSFEALVQEYSDDPGKSTSKGYMEDAGSDQLDTEFRNAASALTEPGEISPVFTDADGHHILKLIARAPDTVIPFDDVKERMIKSMADQYRKDRIAERIAEYRNIPMEADPDLVLSLRTRYANAANTDIDGMDDAET